MDIPTKKHIMKQDNHSAIALLKVLFLFLLLVLFYNNLKAQPPGFSFCKQITINSSQVQGANDFPDFPVLLNITDPDLATVSNGGHITDSITVDVVFTYNGSILNHEVEKYDRSGELIVWVRVPTLFANSNTILNMCYGNCDGTSSGNDVFKNTEYKSVLHLSKLDDSSLNGNSGSSQGGMNSSNSLPGVINNAISFDEIDDAIVIPDFDYTQNNGFSTSFWFNVSDNTGTSYQYMYSHGTFATFESLNIYIPEDNVGIAGYPQTLKTVFQDLDDGTNFDSLDISNVVTGGWHYYVITVDALGDAKVYLDGALSRNLSFQGGDAFDPTTDIYLGGRSDSHSQRYFGGALDEFRLMNTSRSADLIQTEYNNQANNSSFFSIGPEIPTGVTNFLCPKTVLPVTLLEFNAILNGNDVDLNWITSSQINNEFFTLEKSRDARKFIPFAIINGAGNSNSILNYYEKDYDVEDGITYYRLKQTDFNGDYTYSNIIPVNKSNQPNSFYVYPNPSNGKELNLKINELNDDEVLIIIRDNQGKECYSKLIKTNSDINEYKILPQYKLREGMYHILGTSSNQIYNDKIIVK